MAAGDFGATVGARPAAAGSDGGTGAGRGATGEVEEEEEEGGGAVAVDVAELGGAALGCFFDSFFFAGRCRLARGVGSACPPSSGFLRFPASWTMRSFSLERSAAMSSDMATDGGAASEEAVRCGCLRVSGMVALVCSGALAAVDGAARYHQQELTGGEGGVAMRCRGVRVTWVSAYDGCWVVLGGAWLSFDRPARELSEGRTGTRRGQRRVGEDRAKDRGPTQSQLHCPAELDSSTAPPPPNTRPLPAPSASAAGLALSPASIQPTAVSSQSR